MAVDRYIIIRNVHLEGKNALIMAKKVTRISIAESKKNFLKKGAKIKNIVNSTKTKNRNKNEKFLKVQMYKKHVKYQLNTGSDVTLINELGKKLADQFS